SHPRLYRLPRQSQPGCGPEPHPRPLLARYSNLHSWIEAQRWHGTDVCYLRRLHDQYGDVVRVSPRRVSVRDPDAIPIIYGMKASLDKSDLIRAAQPLGKGPDNLFSVRDAKSHSTLRKTVANAYAISTISQYEPRINDILASLFQVLNEQGKETNLGKWAHYYVYDVQGNMTYGEPLGYLEKRKDAVGLIWQTKFLLKYVQVTMPMPILHDIASFFIRTIKAQKATVFHRLTTQKVEERIKRFTADGSVNGKSDILEHFVSAREKYGDIMTKEQIIAHCMVNVVAGTGSSTVVINKIIKYLVKNADAQERLYRELKDAGAGFPASWRELQPLPFLEGLVREGVRLRGSDSFNPLARVAGAQGMVLPDGTQLPAGTLVGIKPTVAAFSEKSFGEHPQLFLPERWLQMPGEGTEAFRERRSRMDRGDMSFSSGTRGCIGRGIALMQIYKMIAALICEYKVITLLPAKNEHRINCQFDFYCALERRIKGE
ncbi:uncharacterized protein PG998_013575, partial [Apiospora kogelbergensis]|uniref:uncharacterized protein n=1 Tax=Apiospora kogelbergensis TaxID=1337665 RepID=UPI00312D9F8D